jgi:hypothetical protein
MNFFVVEQFAVLAPTLLTADHPWLGGAASDWFAKRVLELSYTNIELCSFASDIGFTQTPFQWNLERRITLQAEIDAALLHLYQLTKSQAEWLIDSFTVLRKYEEDDHGKFRTKHLVMGIYDEMAAAKHARRAYQTRLDPPPADPSCCHASMNKAAELAPQPQSVN